MIEVLFNESEGLSMKLAKAYRPQEKRACSTGYIGGGRKPPKSEMMKFMEPKEGKPVGGSKEDVLYIQMRLELGSLSMPIESEYRKNLILDEYKMTEKDDDLDLEDYEEEWERHLSQIARFHDLVQKGETFRMWVGNTIDSLCGFHYACSILKDQGCQVSVIWFPQDTAKPDPALPQGNSWRDIPEGELYRFLPLEKRLSGEEIQGYADHWQDLVHEGSVLRALVEGELKGVSEDHYDDHIRRKIPREPFRLGALIGELMDHDPKGPWDSFYGRRILKMMEQGELELVQEGEDCMYGSVLAKKDRPLP